MLMDYVFILQRNLNYRDHLPVVGGDSPIGEEIYSKQVTGLWYNIVTNDF